MATIKSYTDLQQSKKLAEILSIESADMVYICIDMGRKWINVPRFIEGVPDHADDFDIYAWSLVALLSVIPKRIDEFNVLRIDISTNDFAIWYDEVGCGVNNELPDITNESAVDACYEMILKLHELNLL